MRKIIASEWITLDGVFDAELMPQWFDPYHSDARAVEEISRLKQQPGQNILIPGSATLVQSLMETDLIDEYRFLVHPVIMGRGKSFFKDGLPTTRLKPVKTQTLDLGVTLLCYEPAESP